MLSLDESGLLRYRIEAQGSLVLIIFFPCKNENVTGNRNVKIMDYLKAVPDID